MKLILYIVEFENLDNFQKYINFMNFVSVEKQKKINKFRFDIDKKLSLFSDLLVRYIACISLNLSNKDLLFSKNIYGKPYLLGNPDFKFNISHTRDAIAVGMSTNEIGVDIEKIKSADLKIAERFFCKNELNYIISKDKRQDTSFFEIWTKKEAYTKWIGKGLTIPLTAFDVTSTEINSKMKVIQMNDYIISLCCNGVVDTFEIENLSENKAYQILNEFTGFTTL